MNLVSNKNVFIIVLCLQLTYRFILIQTYIVILTHVLNVMSQTYIVIFLPNYIVVLLTKSMSQSTILLYNKMLFNLVFMTFY